MKCKECKATLSLAEHQKSLSDFGVELCERHYARILKIGVKNNTPPEAVQLYYGLREVGVKAMLEWWNGSKSIDIAVSRVKLNIEIEVQPQLLTQEEAIKQLEEAMHSYKKGFTTLQIPDFMVRECLGETIFHIVEIIDGLKRNIRVI
ncbi:MAG: hypothetical protein AB3N16_00235 [Flavobacteriaceae bacterium]